MKPTLYLETTIIGYLASRPSDMLITAANQQMTRQFWDDHRNEYEVFISHYVIAECAAGDAEAAAERMAFLQSVQSLSVTDDVRQLAVALMSEILLPEKGRSRRDSCGRRCSSRDRIFTDLELQAHC
jgi:hypothetical protein